MNIQSTHHLDIEDLIAVVDGMPLDEAANAHLAGCSVCHSDAERWKAVALGVRYLAAADPLPSTVVFDHTGLSSLEPSVPLVLKSGFHLAAGPPRRRALVAAAALLVIGVGSYGLTTALGGDGVRPTTGRGSATLAAGLTAVNGCSTLAFTSGTLEQVNGSDLVIMTSDGQSVPVTTSPSTNIGREASGSLDDISDGTQVIVNGTEVDGALSATSVGVGAVGLVKMLPPPTTLGGSKGGLAAGTVTDDDADTGEFMVVEPNGTNVAVTTSSSTAIVTLTALTVDQLQVGEFTIVLGGPTQGGTLAAGRVEQGHVPTAGLPQPAKQPPSTYGLPQPKGLPTSSSSKQIGSKPNFGCSSSAVAATALLLDN